MFKMLFVLIAISPEGQEWTWRHDLSLKDCVFAKFHEQNAVIDVQEVHPEVGITFECREQAQ